MAQDDQVIIPSEADLLEKREIYQAHVKQIFQWCRANRAGEGTTKRKIQKYLYDPQPTLPSPHEGKYDPVEVLSGSNPAIPFDIDQQREQFQQNMRQINSAAIEHELTAGTRSAFDADVTSLYNFLPPGQRKPNDYKMEQQLLAVRKDFNALKRNHESFKTEQMVRYTALQHELEQEKKCNASLRYGNLLKFDQQILIWVYFMNTTSSCFFRITHEDQQTALRRKMTQVQACNENLQRDNHKVETCYPLHVSRCGSWLR